jgi:hypothetical protein
MVRRDLRWRGWFLLSYVLGLWMWAWSVLRGWRHDQPHRVIIGMSVHHADIMRSGGFLDPNDPIRFPWEAANDHHD